jgi:hypothetical protein
MFSIPRIVAFASPREEVEVVIASPFSLLVEFSIGWIRGGFPREEIGTSLHPGATAGCRIVQGQPLRAVPEGGEACPSTLKRKWAVPQQDTVLRSSWVRAHMLSPLDPFEPVFVSGVQPGIGVMADNPRVEKVNEVGVSFVDGKSHFGLEQRFR